MMIDRAKKLRWRRKFKRHYGQVEDLGVGVEASLEKHFFKRLGRLFVVRRFVLGWVLLVSLLTIGSVLQLTALSKHYQELQPAPGGTFTEGLLGAFTNANPLYASSPADSAVSRLVFASLMKYDENSKLTNDLAESITVDKTGLTYTVKLRSDLFWHDGQPLTAEDVVFTYQTIQTPDARSPLFSSWNGVKVVARDERTVVFTLPNVLSAFPHALTNGIVPKHKLVDTPVSQLRTDEFNTVNPVGSGPFEWGSIEVIGGSQESRQERIGLLPYERYHGGAAKLQRLVIRTFRSEDLMIERYSQGELSSMSGLKVLPENLKDTGDIHEYGVPLMGATMVFFKTSQAPLNNVKVRQALVQAVDTASVINTLEYPVIRVQGPLLNSQLGFDKKKTQLSYNLKAAQKTLDGAGWKVDTTGFRKKGDQELTFRLHAQSTSEYAAITKALQQAWQTLGVKVEVFLQEDSEIQSTVSRHDYDALLYGVSIGTDPDVFAYWHSSQIRTGSGRLNMSEYKSDKADAALESGRTRTDTAVRAAKYKPFLDAWRNDAPALALYQPRYLYVARGEIFGLKPQRFNSSTDRFSNIHNWMFRQEKVIKSSR